MKKQKTENNTETKPEAKCHRCKKWLTFENFYIVCGRPSPYCISCTYDQTLRRKLRKNIDEKGIAWAEAEVQKRFHRHRVFVEEFDAYKSESNLSEAQPSIRKKDPDESEIDYARSLFSN